MFQVCNHDGLASASVNTVTRLMAQVKAIDRLQLRKRDMIKLLMSSVSTEDGTKMKARLYMKGFLRRNLDYLIEREYFLKQKNKP